METTADGRDNFYDFLEEADLLQYNDLFRNVLKVNKTSQLKYVMTEDLIQIGLSKPEQRRYKKTYSKHFPNPYISKIKKLLYSNRKNGQNVHGTTSSESQPFGDNNVKIPTKHIISIEDITINKELGMGQFGVVQQGTWTTGNQRVQVAIKCLGHERMYSNSSEFLKEAAVMHSIEHPSIVRLFGVVLHVDSLMLVTELAPLRSLLECLREVSIRADFPVLTLCDFAEQICDGMTYLENKRLIHRDLAARNILVFSKDKVKISDFGLSRALGVGKDYYQTNYNVNLKLPVAWCAPECILYLRFTSSSDVWAFGVCLWEMFTYGFQPWAAFSGHQILEAIDHPSLQRLERPECCPEAYYNIMLECWTYDPIGRPTFKDLGPRLRSVRPEQVQATVDFHRAEDNRRGNLLEYKTGDIITVLGKENAGRTTSWYGVTSGGACGMFDSSQTKPYVKPEKALCPVTGPMSPHPTRSSARSIRTSLLRCDVKRHTYTGKRMIQRSMISSPQGDVKHTGHVGLDGAYFGDISFLDPAGCPPRQIVNPYKPSEDLEQVPLLNPSSPSHLSGASYVTSYSLLSPNNNDARDESEDLDTPCEVKMKNMKKSNHKTVSEPTTSKIILNKVKSATLSMAYKGVDAAARADEVHEYHEISDTDTESNVTDVRENHQNQSDSPGIAKSYADFSQSLLDEMESMFRSLDGRRREEPGPGKQSETDSTVRPQSLSKAEKKKDFHTTTMKPMSAHDQRTLDLAVALANEITTKSMNDLDCGENKAASSPSDRSKFHFKFPLVTIHHMPNDAEKDNTGKHERRNFSEEAKSVPDIQSTITEESKHAYTCLIEDPTPAPSATPPPSAPHQTSNELGAIPKRNTMPKPAARRKPRVQFHTLQTQLSAVPRLPPPAPEMRGYKNDGINELPLPPRTTKTKLVDKPRHIRKHPLKVPDDALPLPVPPRPIIYQNTTCRRPPRTADGPAESNGADNYDRVYNAPDPRRYINEPGPSWANPFDYINDDIDIEVDAEFDSDRDSVDSVKNMNEGALVKDCTDHVSVEDLLEFADQKPCGRQRGLESDEVRVMSKVLNDKATPRECLEALELTDWNVHYAIKLIRVQTSAGGGVSLELCYVELKNCDGDVTKASAVIRTMKHAQ